MDKKLMGLVGAVSVLVPCAAAQASPSAIPTTTLQASSFADLLAPIPNAVEKLKASDATLAEADGAKVELAQYHHHHHHHYRPPPPPHYYHHHHHHHYHPHYEH